jgi:hypothetical protein
MKVSGQLHDPTALPAVKEPPIPIGYVVWWTPEPVWTLWRREKILTPAGNQTAVVYPVAMPTELFRLLIGQKWIVNWK